MFKFFRRKKETENFYNKIYILTLEKDGKVWTEEVTGGYLTWFIESGKDLDFDSCKTEEK